MPHRTDTARMVQKDLNRARAKWIAEAASNDERERRERSDFLEYRDHAGTFGDFHSLRHTYCSRLVRRGVPIATAMRLLGHKTVAMTMEIYSHILLPDQRTAVEDAVGDLFAEPDRAALATAG